jgi:hypothetical protein
MAKNESSKDREYRDRENTAPSKQTGNINARNNNTDTSDETAQEPDVERANDTGIGDSAVNNDKLTNFTSNHSADA